MTKMKGLLLGAAAGLVTVASAQAADLPVKAAPVEYVKVCSLYGAGFFYIPGTDTCLKIGGYLRSDHAYGATAAGSGGYYLSALGGDRLGREPAADRQLHVPGSHQPDHGFPHSV